MSDIIGNLATTMCFSLFSVTAISVMTPPPNLREIKVTKINSGILWLSNPSLIMEKNKA